MNKNRLNSVLTFLTAIFFLGLIVFALQMQSGNLHELGISGLFVPDVIGLKKSLSMHYSAPQDIDFDQVRTYLGVLIIYLPSYYFGAVAFFIINIILLGFCFFYFNRSLTFLKLTQKKTNLIAASAGGLTILNYYFLGILQYPNKEVPLLLLTNLFFYLSLKENRIWPLLLVSCCAYFFRDGYGLILAVCTILLGLINSSKVKRYSLVLLTISLFFSAVNVEFLSVLNYALERNVDLAIQGSEFGTEDKVYSYYPYPYRLGATIVNFAVRPQLLDHDGNLYLLNIGFWVFGVTIIAGFFWCLRKIFKGEDIQGKLAFLMLVILLSLSFSAYIQPRYLLPLCMWLAIGLVSKTGGYALGVGFFGPIVMLFFDNLPPRQAGVVVDNFAW